MAAPQNNQGFVQPSSGGTGNWLSKLFGGVGDAARSRSAAQLQLDLHAGKADIDTFHKKDRMTFDTATKEYAADSAYDRSGREMERGIEAGPRMGKSGVSGFDRAGRPTMQKTGASGNYGAAIKTTDEVETTTSATPPKDRASNPARKSRSRNATQKDTVEALKGGFINQVEATEISPTYARNLGKSVASESLTNPDSAATPPKVRKPRKPKADA